MQEVEDRGVTDAALVCAARDGDRLAFAELVDRYRHLVTGVAYNGVGDFSRSEDIAQETFITAWTRGFDLAEPARIAGWLCGIARNLIRNDRRRAFRTPVCTDDLSLAPSAEETPEQWFIRQEESDLLWAILEKIPATYREPMILYYRREAKISDVAAALELSEEAVRQRLSRGRKLLEDKLADFVERTLNRRETSKDFVASVLLALPAGAATKGAGTMSLLAAKLWLGLGVVLGPVIGLAGAVYGSKRSLDQATSIPERALLWKLIGLLSLLVGLLFVGQLSLFAWVPQGSVRNVAQVALWGLYSILLVGAIVIGNRRILRIKREHGTAEEREQIIRSAESKVSPRAAAWNLVGAIGGCGAWMLVVAVRQRDWWGLALVIGLLAATFARFVPRVARAESGTQQMRINWQALLIVLLGTAGIVAARWSLWKVEF
jgi:RNA polymerase sigma factor (sigma-70 family)